MIPKKRVTLKSLNDKVVTPLEDLYDGDITEGEKFPDEVYNVLDNINIDMY